MTDRHTLIRELARAQALFQARAIAAAFGITPPTVLPAAVDRGEATSRRGSAA